MSWSNSSRTSVETFLLPGLRPAGLPEVPGCQGLRFEYVLSSILVSFSTYILSKIAFVTDDDIIVCMPNSNDFKHNHYVPEWYQKRFIPSGYPQSEIQYLDLNPPQVRDAKGKLHTFSALRSRPVSGTFAQDDLYTTKFGTYRI